MFKVIKELLFGKRFEFDTTYSLHEVHDRLQSMSERDYVKLPFWKSKYRLLRVRMERIDKQSFRFKGDRDEGRNMVVVTKGAVMQDISCVHITGKVRLGRWTLIPISTATTILLVFVVSIVSAILKVSITPLEALLALIIPLSLFVGQSVFWWWLRNAQNQLYDQIHTILEKSKQKHTESVEIQLFKDRLKR